MDAKRREEIIARDLAESHKWSQNKMKQQTEAATAKTREAQEASKRVAEERAKPKAEESFVDKYNPSNLFDKLRGKR